MIPNKSGVLFGVVKVEVVRVAPYEYSKNHWTVHCETVNFMACESYVHTIDKYLLNWLNKNNSNAVIKYVKEKYLTIKGCNSPPNWSIDSMHSQSEFLQDIICRNWQAGSKTHMKCKGPRGIKTTLKTKNKIRGVYSHQNTNTLKIENTHRWQGYGVTETCTV